MQGIWSPEEQLIEQQDAYSGDITKQFKEEIKKAVAAVYGDVTIPQKQGAASGEYKANAGKYLMAWHLGTEWDPGMVKNTNKVHSDVKAYQGKYFSGTKTRLRSKTGWPACLTIRPSRRSITVGSIP